MILQHFYVLNYLLSVNTKLANCSAVSLPIATPIPPIRTPTYTWGLIRSTIGNLLVPKAIIPDHQ